MKIVSFNVNSIRARVPLVEALVAKHAPDILGLQETKVRDEEFPLDWAKHLGYHVVFHGQKTHYGVALLARLPFVTTRCGFPGDSPDAQRRVVSAQFTTTAGQTLSVINAYFPQGESRDHAVKFPAKQKFYHNLLVYLRDYYRPEDLVLVMGDMNVAPLDQDIGIGADNARRWLQTGKCSFLPEEREWYTLLTEWGLLDTYRLLYPEQNSYFSWFDYRSRGFEADPKRGLRIDHILASSSLRSLVTAAGIDYELRALPKPSDHCPVWVELTL